MDPSLRLRTAGGESMNRYAATLIFALMLIVSLACSSARVDTYQESLEGKSKAIVSGVDDSRVSFEDKTEEVVGRAERLIEKNDKEGAVLDQRWYTLKRFGQHQEAIFSASHIVFYGGLENDVQAHLQKQYSSFVPIERDQEPGEIRLFFGKRTAAQHDLIIIGQRGNEVALKTIIRLIYLASFADDENKRKHRAKLQLFSKSLKVFMSSRTAQQEFIGFFAKHGISSPDTVMIGFIGDSRSLMKAAGIGDPEVYSDESLQVNWYKNANGRRVLLVSIDHNRIFASRSGELIEAIFKISGDSPPSVTFLGSGGAIDEPAIVGEIATPTIVLKGDPFPAVNYQGVVVHLIRNKAIAPSNIKTAHASVESVIVETTQWAHKMKMDRVRTVDQELFHIVDAVNSSGMGLKVAVFVGILLTDNVSSEAAANSNVTLEHAEETISKTISLRREFLSNVLTRLGILDRDRSGLDGQKEVAF